ncbi:type IV secretory system conjugative DNA transfer family protein [Puniceicoccaceae bacterium K14]|nr:type IV secretory system conjugative DNA transfer family protein [Puniceicoccaceae bacterium K14]
MDRIDIIKDFPRGAGGSLEGQSPNASFIPTQAIMDTPSLKYRDGCHFLGVVGAEVKSERAKDGRLLRWAEGGHFVGVVTEKHVLTIAPTRSDKGRAGVMPNALLYPGSMLITSAKDDVIKESVKHRHKALGQECYVIAPYFNMKGFEEHLAYFNPLSILTPESPTLIEDADLIADSLIVDEQSSEPHWNDKARSWVGRGLIAHVATFPDYEGRRDLSTVYDLLMTPTEDLEEEMAINKSAGGIVKHAIDEYLEMPEEERGSVLSTARRHLGFLAYPEIQRALIETRKRKAVDLSALKRKRATLYVSLPAMRLSTCGRLFRMIVQLALAAMEREEAKPEFPVRMCLDEFAAFGRLKSVDTAIGQIAGLGVRLHIVLQDLVQLNAIYGKRAESFLANAGLIQCFANSDNITLEWIEKRLGKTTVLLPQYNDTSQEELVRKGRDATSWQLREMVLMTSEEISRFFGQQDAHLRQLVILPGFSPLVLQRAYYDKYSEFMK